MRMSQHRPVPRLDLAPKLRRPLSLWNPLDYLRLLYWVFFFPQALRRYVDIVPKRFLPDEKKNWKNLWGLSPNPILRQLVLQAIALVVITPLALGIIFKIIGFSLDWSYLVGSFLPILVIGIFILLTVLISLLSTNLSEDSTNSLSIAHWTALSIALGVTLSFEISTINAASKVVFTKVTDLVPFSLVVGAGWGVAGVIALSILIDVGNYVTPTVGIFVLAISAITGFAIPSEKVSQELGIITSLLFILVSGTASLLGACLAMLRPDNWLFSLHLAQKSFNKIDNFDRQFPHVTVFPVPCLYSHLKHWLQQDWETGIHNAKQLCTYTLQFIPVIKALNQVLAETPLEQVIYRVAQLAEPPYQLELLRFVSGSLVTNPPRLDTPTRAAAAGFWFLHEKMLRSAAEAFAVVRSLPHGEEMLLISLTLSTFGSARNVRAIATLEMPAFPKEPLLRPVTWKAFASLRRIAEDIQVIHYSLSRSARAFALSRALGELKNLRDNPYAMPKPEQELIRKIALYWSVALLDVASEVGKVSITEQVHNPYVVGDPVQEDLFVGRDDVMRQLEGFWVMSHRLQSVVLYGHRRMGKTSILLNAANCSGSGVKVAYINLLRLGDSPQGVGEVLMAISDAISDALGCTPPADADLLNLPYRTFERYLKQVEALLSGGLIVALDEFEKIEELIEAGKIPTDFMGYLRGLVQMSSKVAFAFAGLHTLEEMTADYFQPFFASVITIHVGFLQPGATRQILANPDEDFPLDYTPEALDQIYALTAGQPYLVQLVGFQLVRRYNDYVFEQGRPRNPVFTVEDVEAVINDPEFFKRGRYYFDGVWGQAARGASGQQAILRALAPHPEGLSIDELRTKLNEIVGAHSCAPLQEETLLRQSSATMQEALKTLTRHDVVQQSKGCWYIIVEVFRRWVVQT